MAPNVGRHIDWGWKKTVIIPFNSLKDTVDFIKEDEQRSGLSNIPGNMGRSSVLRKHCFRPAKKYDDLEPEVGVGPVQLQSENDLEEKYILDVSYLLSAMFSVVVLTFVSYPAFMIPPVQPKKDTTSSIAR